MLFSRGDSEDPRLGDVAVMPSLAEFERRKWDWTIIGLSDDRGVGLNGGRLGAGGGPSAIRKWFYRLVPPCRQDIADLGDLVMSEDLDADHKRAAEAIATALGKSSRVAVLGGGHDWGYAPIAALLQGGTVGFMNFDAHLDVRASNVHHSGTSYWRALEAGVKGENAHWVGVQRAATAELHQRYVEAHGGTINWSDSTMVPAIPKACEYLDISIDMDVFSIAEAPGVSAPQPLGLSAASLMPLLTSAFSAPHLRTVGLYETAPLLDCAAESTTRLAARLLWQALRSSHSSR